jgi:hypothetical protein
MSIRETVEQRAKFRAECRIVADALLEVVLKRLDDVPESLHRHIITMLVSELNIATRKTGNEKSP